jgi:hypothetical protein
VGHLHLIVFRLGLSEKAPPKSFCEPNPNENQWNWVIVARGTEKLFRATKGFINVGRGSIKYQKLSGYRFHVEEMRPDSDDEANGQKDGANK